MASFHAVEASSETTRRCPNRFVAGIRMNEGSLTHRPESDRAGTCNIASAEFRPTIFDLRQRPKAGGKFRIWQEYSGVVPCPENHVGPAHGRESYRKAIIDHGNVKIVEPRFESCEYPSERELRRVDRNNGN